MFIYQIQAYKLHNGEKINEVILSVTAANEELAYAKAATMVDEREFMHTLTVEDVPADGIQL